MSPDENGVLKFVHAKNLYRDWSTVVAVLRACHILALVMFLLTLVFFAIAEKISLRTITLPAKIAGGVYAISVVLMLPAFYLLAWAKGGVDEWEYEVKPWHVKGRKIIRHPGRMKALRGLLRDSEKKDFDIWLFNDAEVTGDEKTGTIELESHGQNEEIHVSPEDYAQVFEYITFKPKRRRKTASKTTKKEKAIP